MVENLGEVSSDDSAHDQQVSRFVLFGAFGEVMLRFQTLESRFENILSYYQEQDIQPDQRLEELALRANLPPEVSNEAEPLVKDRNNLAHRFLRNWAPHLHDAQSCETASQELADILGKVDTFEPLLESYTQQVLGMPSVTDRELEELGITTDLF